MGGGGGVEETPDQIQEQQNNAKLWNYYQTSYKPFIDKYIARQTSNAASDAEVKKAAGQVNAEVMKGVTGAAGGPPGQPNTVNMTRQMDTAAEISTAGQSNAAGKVKQRQMGSLQNIVDIGRGQQTNAMQAQEEIAGQSVQSAIQNKEADLRLQGAEENAAGSIIGAGAAVGMRSMKPSTGSSGLPDDVYGAMQDNPYRD